MSTIDWNDVILEFYEVCIHNLLYAREVYPRHIFENRRYLGASVWQSRHPDINAYIRRVLDNAKPLLIKVTCTADCLIVSSHAYGDRI